MSKYRHPQQQDNTNLSNRTELISCVMFPLARPVLSAGYEMFDFRIVKSQNKSSEFYLYLKYTFGRVFFIFILPVLSHCWAKVIILLFGTMLTYIIDFIRTNDIGVEK